MTVSERASTSVGSYIRTQGAISAVVTAVLNVLILWLTNGAMAPVLITMVTTDLVITSVLVGLLCALFAGRGLRHERGRLERSAGDPRATGLLLRLPSRPGYLGLLVGAACAVGVVVVLSLLGTMGLTGLSFAAFAALKAVYTGLLAYAVTRWVVLRQLASR